MSAILPDLIVPGQVKEAPSASQGGTIFIVILVVAAALIALVLILSRRAAASRKTEDEPSAAFEGKDAPPENADPGLEHFGSDSSENFGSGEGGAL